MKLFKENLEKKKERLEKELMNIQKERDLKQLEKKIKKLKTETKKEEKKEIKKVLKPKTDNYKFVSDLEIENKINKVFVKKEKEKFFKQLLNKFNPNKKDKKGYIFYLDKTLNLKIYEVKNFYQDLNINNREKFIINQKIGTYKGKPFLLIKSPIPITLDINDRDDALCFDSEVFYNVQEHIITRNLTKGKSEGINIIDSIRKNWIIILILLIIAYIYFSGNTSKVINWIMGQG